MYLSRLSCHYGRFIILCIYKVFLNMNIWWYSQWILKIWYIWHRARCHYCKCLKPWYALSTWLFWAFQLSNTRYLGISFSSGGTIARDPLGRGARLQKILKQLGFETCFDAEGDFLENFCEFLESWYKREEGLRFL